MVSSSGGLLYFMFASGIDTMVTLQEDKIVVSALLKNISIKDPDQLSLYPNVSLFNGYQNAFCMTCIIDAYQ